MKTRIQKYVARCCICIIATLALPGIALAANETVQIMQSRGADQSVHYQSLQKFGPWDDRNYQLTAADLTYLAKNESELHAQIPAFFRVELRKEWPHLQKTGAAQYPRAANQLFEIRYGGLMRNGVIANDRREAARVPVPVNSEVQLNQVLGANEVTVEINPSNPLQVIAGSNNNGGQEMYYSTDGGTSWTIQGVLPDTCCDPTIDWSSDGTIAYAAALSGSIGVSAWRSLDGGQSWVNRVNLTPSGSDKEWVHVDKSPTSPYQDNVYLTYHNGNVMQFARSVNMGLSYTIQSLGGPSGIGSDITTTSNGDIYYAYGAFNSQTIEVLKSTDGGTSFGSAGPVTTTNGSFDFPIPSMESRRAWIYTATDADRSGGPFDGSVYVSWTDTVSPENDGSATANHTRVYVAYSRDGGANWDLSTPHSTDDMDTVDRWNQWMTVDANGVVHVVFYDTRNSLNRTGVDLYYTFSIDGGVTWNSTERISSETSENLTGGQEFGDYNGISVVGEKIVTTWTDNRNGTTTVSEKDVFAAEALNIAAEPGFTLTANTANQAVCVPGDLQDITVSIGSIQGFMNPVTLNLNGLPPGFSGDFSANPVTPTSPSTPTTASISVGGVATGDYSFTIDGSAMDGADRSVTINVAAAADVTGAAILVSPGDNSMAQSTSPVLTWNPVAGALSYIVELDDDPAFGSIDFTESTTNTSATAPTLATETLYFWRVRAINPCGESANSIISSFTTNLALCATGPVAIPDSGGEANPASLDLSAASAGTLTDLNVSINVTHTWVGDLIATLEHVDTGTSVVLIDRPGVPASSLGCSSNDIDAIMDDEGFTPVENQCGPGPALAGSLIPQEPLSAFDGEDIGGTWVLTVSDNFGQDTGTIDEWCLLPAIFEPNPDSDGDGLPDSIDNCTDVANADQRDTNGDNIGNACDADIDNDCGVNFLDLNVYKANFFSAGDLDTDNNGDNVTNFLDLNLVKSQFFGPPGPSAAGCN